MIGSGDALNHGGLRDNCGEEMLICIIWEGQGEKALQDKLVPSWLSGG
jgi:hypothetical protein